MSAELAVTIASAVVAAISAVGSVAALLWARSSARASERSATAAEDMAAYERAADVIPAEYQPNAQTIMMPGAVGVLIVTNHGRGPARAVSTYVQYRGRSLFGVLPSLMGGETGNLPVHDYPSSLRDLDDPLPNEPLSNEFLARAKMYWEEGRGSTKEGPWTTIQVLDIMKQLHGRGLP